MKKILLFLGVLVLWVPALAQEVISNAGESQKTSTIELSWTLGEPVIETVSSDSNILTQGFQQTKLIVTAIDPAKTLNINVKVFPNPTDELVTIQLDKPEIGAIFSLYDFDGKLLQTSLISDSQTKLVMKNYANGTYLLKISISNTPSPQSYKIVKK